MSKRIVLIVVAIVLSVFIIGCQVGASTPESEPPRTVQLETTQVPKSELPSADATPEAGQGFVTGRLFSEETEAPISRMVVRLAEVYYPDDQDKNREDGMYVLDNAYSPSAVTQEGGLFVFENVVPRDYVMLVGDVNVDYEVITKENGDPRIWTVEADKTLDVGEIYVNLN